MTTQQRKIEHLKVCIGKNVEMGDTFFNDVFLLHNAAPEVNFSKIDTTTEFFGKKLKIPLMITAITGGTQKSTGINKALARTAEKYGMGLGLGSQKAMIEDPKLLETYYVRDVAPNALLFGNIGYQRLGEWDEKIIEAAEKIEADGICVHFNAAQESFQKTEEIETKDVIFEKLESLCKASKLPIIAKEVGNGVSRETALKFKNAGVKAIDVAGVGGTSWIAVDAIRSGKDIEGFEGWGIPTAAAILEAKETKLPLIASGGIRNGVHIAKSIALGAEICGVANFALKSLCSSIDECNEKRLGAQIENISSQLRTAMFLTGNKNIGELKKTKFVVTGKLKDWVEQRKLLKL